MAEIMHPSMAISTSLRQPSASKALLTYSRVTKSPLNLRRRG
jgi:hypothetical protein